MRLVELSISFLSHAFFFISTGLVKERQLAGSFNFVVALCSNQCVVRKQVTASVGGHKVWHKILLMCMFLSVLLIKAEKL